MLGVKWVKRPVWGEGAPVRSWGTRTREVALRVWLRWQSAGLVTTKPWISSPAPHSSRHAITEACNPSPEVKAWGSEVVGYSWLHIQLKANTATWAFISEQNQNREVTKTLSVFLFWVSLSLPPSSGRVPCRQAWPWTGYVAELTSNFWSSSQVLELQTTVIFWSSVQPFWNFLQHMPVQMSLPQEPNYKCDIGS